MIFASYNIQYGLGRDGTYDLDRIADEIRHADVIALQEVDRFWQRSGMIDAPDYLSKAMPDHYWVYGPNLDMDASYRDNNGRLINRRRQFGTMIMSRCPILSCRNFPLPKRGLVTQHSIQQGVLEAVIAPNNHPLRIYCTHLSHLCVETRLPQIEAMLDIFRKSPEEGGAWCGGHPDPDSGWTEGEIPPMPHDMMLMGDLNLLPDSPEYDRLIGPKSPNHGRLVSPHGLADAWVCAGHQEADGSTHPMTGRIDHCLLSASLANQVRAFTVGQEAQGSDHYPIFIDLDI
nr:endonuclease/exonuclease/phosphatase family protein [uncultured Cohaesibacter sp.]